MGRKALPKYKHKKRDYKREYRRFGSSLKAKKKALGRKRNRRKALRLGTVKVGDGKDIHHKGSKTRIMSRSANRGKIEASRRKGSKRNKRMRGK